MSSEGNWEAVFFLLLHPGGSSHPVVRRIVKSKFSQERFNFSWISYSTAYSSFQSYVSTFVSDASLYGTHSVRVRGANDPGS